MCGGGGGLSVKLGGGVTRGGGESCCTRKQISMTPVLIYCYPIKHAEGLYNATVGDSLLELTPISISNHGLLFTALHNFTT